MTTSTIILTLARTAILVGALAACGAETAEPLAAMAERAHAAPAGSAATLSELETVMDLGTDLATETSKRAEGDYWKLIRESGDYPRAYRFFSDLARRRPASAEALGCSASATGAYVGWLFQAGLGGYVTIDLKLQAEAQFTRALGIEPGNVTALFGLTIYDSRAPGRQQRCQDDLARLKAAIAEHPECQPMVAELERSLRAPR